MTRCYRRGRSVSSSRQSTPAPSRIHIDNTVQDIYRGSNPYDAHGPYDDDYHVTGPSRPPPVPYDDPYADVPTSDVRIPSMQLNGEPGGEPDCGGPQASRGRVSSRGTRGRGVRNRQLWNTSRRGYHHNPISSQRTFDLDSDRASRSVECATGYGQIVDGVAPHSLVRPAPNTLPSPETNNIQDYRQPFIQPHINPRFASMFGFDLPSASMIPGASQNAQGRTFMPHHWVDTWTTHGNAGSEGEGDTYRPM